MTISQRGTPVVATGTPSNLINVTGTWPTGSTQTAGDLLLAVVTGYNTTAANAFLSSEAPGWAQVAGSTAVSAGGSFAAVYILTIPAVGGDVPPNFLLNGTGTAADSSLNVVLYDLFDSGGGTPQVVTYGTNVGTTTPLSVTTAGTVPAAGCFAICGVINSKGVTAATGTWTTPTSWTLGASTTASLQSHMASFFFSSPPSGSTLAVSLAWPTPTATTNAAGVTVVIQPPVAGAIAVTAQQIGGGVYQSMAMTVKVVTGVAASPIGATIGLGSGTTESQAITPLQTGSWVYGAASEFSKGAVFTAFSAATTFSQNYLDTCGANTGATFRTTNTDTAATPVTLGGNATGLGAGNFTIALCEIRTAGVLAESATAPQAAAAISQSLTLVTTSFAPVVGSLLVAQIETNGNGVSCPIVSVSSGSLLWTEQINGDGNSGTNFSNYSGIWTAPFPQLVDRVSITTTRQAVKRSALW